MQKTDTLVKIISVLALIAIAVYIGIYIFNAVNNPLQTAAAMEYTIKETAQSEGYAIRTEMCLDDATARVSVTADEGEKLAAGSTYALEFASKESMEAADAARELEHRINYLAALLVDSGAGVRMARESVSALAYSLSGSGLTVDDDLLSDIRVKIFNTDSDEESVSEALEDATSQLKQLESSLDTDMERMTTDYSGIFSSFTDGFEGITAENISDITPDELNKLFSNTNRAETNAIGKVVTDIYWRYAAVMKVEDVVMLSEGSEVTLDFSKTYNETVNMKIESIGKIENGRCVVVFVSDRNLKDIIGIRELTADVIFSVKSGIRVPTKAIHEDEEGQQFVYVISGVQAQRVDITAADEYDEYTLVEPSSGLRDGMEVIVEANELYSGKVVR